MTPAPRLALAAVDAVDGEGRAGCAGASRPAQVVENMKALDVVAKLTPEFEARIDAAVGS